MKVISDPREVSITGNLFAVYTEMSLENGLRMVQPVLLTLEGNNYFPIFTTHDKLTVALDGKVKAAYSVKHIDDGRGFLASIPLGLPVIQDPWITPEGATRFMRVVSAR